MAVRNGASTYRCLGCTADLGAIRRTDDGLRVFAIAAGILARYREGGTLELTVPPFMRRRSATLSHRRPANPSPRGRRRRSATGSEWSGVATEPPSTWTGAGAPSVGVMG